MAGFVKFLPVGTVVPRIRRSHPLADDLVCCFLPSFGEIATGTVPTNVGNVNVGTTSWGSALIAPGVSASIYQDYSSITPNNSKLQNGFSAVFGISQDNSASTNTVFQYGGVCIQGGGSFVGYQFTNSGTTQINNVGYGNSDLQVAGVTRLPSTAAGSTRFFIDGRLKSSSVGNITAVPSVAGVSFGGQTASSNVLIGANLHFGMLFSRVLSDVEMLAISSDPLSILDFGTDLVVEDWGFRPYAGFEGVAAAGSASSLGSVGIQLLGNTTTSRPNGVGSMSSDLQIDGPPHIKFGPIPNVYPRLNTGHPLVKDAIVCIVPSFGSILQTPPKAATIGGGASFNVTRAGIAAATYTNTDLFSYASNTDWMYRSLKGTYTFFAVGSDLTINTAAVTANGGGFMWATPAASPSAFGFGFSNTGKLQLSTGSNIAQGSQIIAKDPRPRAFAAAHYNGGQIRFFVDGILDSVNSNGTSAVPFLSSGYYTNYGLDANGNPAGLVGNIHLVMLFNRALSDIEIQELSSDPLQVLDFGSEWTIAPIQAASLLDTIIAYGNISADLLTSITASSSMAGSATYTGSVLSYITFLAPINGIAIVGGNITTSVTASTSVAGHGTLQGAATTSITARSGVAGHTTLVSALNTAITMSARASGTNTLTAAISTIIAAASGVAGRSLLQSDISTVVSLAAKIASVSAISVLDALILSITILGRSELIGSLVASTPAYIPPSTVTQPFHRQFFPIPVLRVPAPAQLATTTKPGFPIPRR